MEKPRQVGYKRLQVGSTDRVFLISDQNRWEKRHIEERLGLKYMGRQVVCLKQQDFQAIYAG